MQACPKNCISFFENDLGFLYPKIDNQFCVDCGLCQKVCPSNIEADYNTPQNVFAAISKDNYDYNTATSGGIATLFGKKTLEKRGVVYGAAFSDDEVKHIRIENTEEIDKIKGSKYVQSRIDDSFLKIKQDLQNNYNVLFVGTPCQVAGLKKFLAKDYQNLITCDLVCHGVPSAKLLKEHIYSLNLEEKYDGISFRDKSGFYLTLYLNNKIVYRKRNFKDVYYIGFLKGLFYRKSCYGCKYAKSDRVSDITLGDFWGFDSQKGEFPVSTTNGLSLVMINTEKGAAFWDECKSGAVFTERDLKEAVNGNKQLRHPAVKHRNYDKFVLEHSRLGFKKTANKLLLKERIIYGILDMIGR